jgi:hypothetical protein
MYEEERITVLGSEKKNELGKQRRAWRRTVESKGSSCTTMGSGVPLAFLQKGLWYLYML